MHDYIPYGHQFIDDNDIKSVVDVLRSDWLTQGPTVELFERALAHFFGARYAVTLSSGTAALHASYFAAGLHEPDEIMTSPITYISTANAARFLGCRIKFIDIEPETANIDTSLIDEHVAVNTRAIVPVDFAGQPADLREIKSIAREHNLIVIEDACHAIGAEYQGAKVGNVSDLTIFSFHPVKNMTTGEGGAVLTSNRDFYERLLMFRNNGVTRSEEMNETYGPWYYEMRHLGFNYRLTDLQCALGLSQLRKLDSFIRRRREIVSHYNQAFRGIDEVEPLVERRDRLSAWHIYVIKLNQKGTAGTRKEVFLKLRRAGIGVQVHYIPVYWQPYYQKLGYTKGLCIEAEAYYESAITLPVFPSMTDEQAEKVVDAVQRECKRYARELEKRYAIQSMGVLVDLTDTGSIESMVSAVLSKFTKIDILINNAAYNPQEKAYHVRFEDFSLESWNRILAVNLTGVFLCTQAVAKEMAKQGYGNIINVSSIYGMVGADQRIYGTSGINSSAAYAASKAGVANLTRYLSAYFEGKNIRVNTLTLGGCSRCH